MIAYRDATPADAAVLAEIGRRSFVETFGHLYTPEDLAAFLANHNEANWRGELDRSRLFGPLAEADGEPVGFAKLGPPACRSSRAARRSSFASSTCSSPGRARASPRR
jgi:hypothetical protein